MTAPAPLSDMLNDPGRSVSVGDQITARLRDAIVYADLLPGTRLKQEELARQFGTSRVPLREAMRQLAAEGLIEWTSNKSAIVRSLEIDELRELFELAAILEPRATFFGVPKLTDDDIRALRDLNRQIGEERTNPRTWYETNLKFHLLPMLRSDQRHTVNMVVAIRANLNRFFMIPSLYGDPDSAWHDDHQREHGELLDAFARRDAKSARKLVETDWRSAWMEWQPFLATMLDRRER